MKKILSVLLAAAMLVTTLCVIALPTSAAVEGEWTIYTSKSQYQDGWAGLKRDTAGYHYEDGVGLVMDPAPWADSNPYATFQTKAEWDFSLGMYLQVRVDKFTYTASDAWFGFSVWDDENVELGQVSDYYGHGVETLIRFAQQGENAGYDANDNKTWPGAMKSLEWYDDTGDSRGERVMSTDKEKAGWNHDFENGCPIITIEIKYNDGTQEYEVYINNVKAPQHYNTALTEHFPDGKGYIGFSLQNNVTGGTVGCTILKFGTSAGDATPPDGDDSKTAVVEYNTPVPNMPATDIAAGDAAIRLTGSVATSNVAGKPSSYMSNVLAVKDDNTVNIIANAKGEASLTFNVNNNISYTIQDFPYALIIIRNFCNCEYKDKDGNGEIDAKDMVCTCNEYSAMNAYIMAGNIKTDDPKYTAKPGESEYIEPFEGGDGNTYQYFVVDFSALTAEGATNKIDGRINAIRLDFAKIREDYDRNAFDICEIAFYKEAEEASAYFEQFIESLGGDVDDESGTAGENDESDSEAASDESDSEPATGGDEESGSETEAAGDVDGSESEKTTDDAEKKTDKPEEKTEEKTDKPDASENGGCGSVVGVGAIAVVALAAAGLVSFRKKED